MLPYYYQRQHMRLSLDPVSLILAIEDTADGTTYRTDAPAEGFQPLQVSCEEDGIRFSFIPPGFSTAVSGFFTVEETGPVCAKLILSSCEAGSTAAAYPPPFRPSVGDTALYPYGEGVAFAVNDSDTLIPRRQSLFDCSDSSMSFWGLLRGTRQDRWLLAAVETNADAVLVNEQGADGLWRTGVEWLPQKGHWGYDRIIRFCIGRNGSIAALCGEYRRLADRRGFRVSLMDKATSVPEVGRLACCANVWLWNDDAMEKLYSPDRPYSIPSLDQLKRRREIALDMKESGMEQVLWSIFDENVDPDTVEYVKSLGFLTTIYDIYTDVIPQPVLSLIPDTRRIRGKPRQELWPGGVVTKQDGSLLPAWKLKGTDGQFHDQNRICDQAGYACARDWVPGHAARTGIQGRFLDVLMTGANECYHPDHLQTRGSSIVWQQKQLHLMAELGLLCGTEIGREDGAAFFHYNEGMLSPPLYRAYDSGRRMTHLYEDVDQVNHYLKYMLNPECRVPLWELVYHDCVVSYWYWGDSTNCCPALIERRDLFCMLYGLPPLYSFRASDWEVLKPLILASNRRTSMVTALTAGSPIITFDYPEGQHLIQRTRFENGVSVTVNFSENAYQSDDKGIISPMSAAVLRPDGVVLRP